MKEIRVAWTLGLHENVGGDPISGGAWLPDTPAVREELEIIIAVSIESYGEGTHWLEEREV